LAEKACGYLLSVESRLRRFRLASKRRDSYSRRRPIESLNDVALFVVLETRRRPAIQAHAEHESMALQHFLDLGE